MCEGWLRQSRCGSYRKTAIWSHAGHRRQKNGLQGSHTVLRAACSRHICNDLVEDLLADGWHGESLWVSTVIRLGVGTDRDWEAVHSARPDIKYVYIKELKEK